MNSIREGNGECSCKKIITHLCTGCVPQIIRPVELKPQVVVSMDHLVGHSILQVALAFELVCADPYAVVRLKSTGMSHCASLAIYVVPRYVPAELLNVALN